MALPEEALRDGEDVLLDTRPSWTALAGPVAVGASILVACIAGVVEWSSAPVWFGWLVLGLLLLTGTRVATRVLLWRSTSLAVTTARVVYRSGVLRRVGREIPIESVQDVSFRQSLFERLGAAGSVTVESAGERGALPFVDVPRPERFQELVNRAAATARAGRGGAQGGSRRSDPTIPEQIGQLAELLRRGVLSEQEFQTKKAELLRRM